LRRFSHFLGCLDALDWNIGGQIDSKVLPVLSALANEPEAVQDLVTSWTSENLERRQLSCHETATHYKWFIYFNKRWRFKVWLHQYKTAEERRLGYAEVPHNHRYSLASVILSGGFTHHYFDRSGGAVTESLAERVRFGPGDAYIVQWQRIHKLSELRDRTFTVVVESAPVRSFSEAFYPTLEGPTIFYDFVGLRGRLVRELGALPGSAAVNGSCTTPESGRATVGACVRMPEVAIEPDIR
jgi:hypothetical protein